MVDASWVWSLRGRLAPRVLPLLAFCAAFLPVVSGSRSYVQDLMQLSPVHDLVQATAVGLLAAAGVAVAPRRMWPLLAVTAVDAVTRPSGLLVAVTSYVVATTCSRRPHLAVYAMSASLLFVVPPPPGTALASSLGGVALFVWLPMALGLWATARGQVLEGLRERADRLEREQSARTERARARERARIARDMHDVVAHRVSLMVLYAGALEINAAEPVTATRAELIRTTGVEALTQLRAVLEVLHTPSAGPPRPGGEPLVERPALADLDRLLDRSRSAGVPVDRRDEGTARPLPAMVEHAAYRVVQEALTNVHKHAGAVATRVTLRFLPSALEVTVGNAPGGGDRVLPGGGFGLAGLRERVKLLEGEFTAGREADGGFTVRAWLPT
ncbi:histidine kinase [Streptosporangium sp. NPDC002524]|uniref:sensor histidine kinase n=1 Tax=Streptosporangium sp. NPDC002524 TaxID=3154537 RepID=UPI0033284ADF